MNKNTAAPLGYVVALVRPENRNIKNPQYCGIDRLPEYPSRVEQESQALDQYVFGDYKDLNSNLIPTFVKALKLWTDFSVSTRDFEILLCSTGAIESEISGISQHAKLEPMGFDIAGVTGDYWSIVNDIPGCEWSRKYAKEINEFGLFNTYDIANSFLGDYIRHGEPDNDSDFSIVFVSRVRVIAATDTGSVSGQ